MSIILYRAQEKTSHKKATRSLTGRTGKLLGSLGFALTIAFAGSISPTQAEIILPDLGGVGSVSLSEQAERRLGQENMVQLKRAGAVLEDPELNAYLNKLGDRLLEAGSLDPTKFEFFAVPSWEINAFALPGGFIGINLGLISTAKTESELASVIAHEITHVTQRHIARQMDAQKSHTVTALAGIAAAIAAAAAGNGELASAALTSTVAGQMQSQINYTRENEHEADRIGFKLLVRAGFAPAGMAHFFERLQAETQGEDLAMYSYLLTHPLTRDRIAEAQNRAYQSPTKAVSSSVDFDLVLALTQSYKGSAEHAIEKFDEKIRASSGHARSVARYGKAASQLRVKRYRGALATLEQAKAEGLQHPMVEALAGQALLLDSRADEAVALYERALQTYPDHKQLVYDYPRALLSAGKKRQAAEFSERKLQRSRDSADYVLHEVAAEAWADLNENTRSHLHLGEYYAARHNYLLAFEQFEIAYDADDAGPQKHKVVKHRMNQIEKERRRMLRAAMQENPEAIASKRK